MLRKWQQLSLLTQTLVTVTLVPVLFHISGRNALERKNRRNRIIEKVQIPTRMKVYEVLVRPAHC